MEAAQKFADDNATFQRLFVNSFTQKQQGGNDIEFTIDLGRDFNFNQISIDQCTIENKFINFYDSQRYDFRYLNFKAIVGGEEETIILRVQQFVDRENFTAYLTDMLPDYAFSFIDTPFEDYKLHFRVSRVGLSSITLEGDGWVKLGVKKGQYTTPGGGQIDIHGSSLYDFAGPPTILLSMSPLFGQGSITNQFGTHMISVQNTASFGDRIFYTNTQKNTCATLFNTNRQSVRFLEVKVYGCDQTLLETPVDSDGKLNNNDLEIILLLSVQ